MPLTFDSYWLVPIALGFGLLLYGAHWLLTWLSSWRERRRPMWRRFRRWWRQRRDPTLRYVAPMWRKGYLKDKMQPYHPSRRPKV